jgi:hypothetical protein
MTRRWVAAAIASIVMVLGLLVGVAAPAGATTFTPGEGSGSGWCAAYGGTNQASYDNVYACSPNTGSAGATPFDETAGFQCVELANRFLWDAYSDEPIFGSNLNGWNFAQTVHADYPSVPLDTNGTAGEPYLPGDIVSFTGNSGTPVAGLGHVAVVTASSENSAGNGSITVMQENATPYSQSLTVSNWSLQMPSGSWVTPYQFDAFANSNPPPTISSVSPDEGETGTPITISGSNLANASSVTFNGVAAAISGDTASSITTTVPSGATTGNIVVTTPYGSASAAFTVDAVELNTWTVINQNTGLVSVFVEGPNHTLDTYWATPGVTGWSAALVIGGAASTYSTPAAVINQSTGLVSVFVEGPNHTLDTYWATPGVTGWSAALVIGRKGSTYQG